MRTGIAILAASFVTTFSLAQGAAPTNSTTTAGSVSTPTSGIAGNAATAGNQFGFDLFKLNSKAGGNQFFSPLSIEAALAMTSAGAQKETLAQMNKVLHLSQNPHRGFEALLNQLKGKAGYELLVANRLWTRQGKTYVPEFVNVLKTNYGSEVIPMDFQNQTEPSRVTINQWVQKQTNDKIKDLLPPGFIEKATELVITNAVYFKGRWENAFHKSETKSDDFFTAAKVSVKTPFMHQTSHFSLAETAQAQMLEIPYRGGTLSFVVVLPKSEPLEKFETEFSYDHFLALRKNTSYDLVQVSLPKFKAESRFDLAEVLSNLGMPLAFDPSRANFHGIRTFGTDVNIYISKVVHKAFVDVNEEGTEAAAATAVGMVNITSMPSEPHVFNANRPFLYFIVEKSTGAILFFGRYAKP